ncbi:hypothetical protein E4U59_006960 [Claviceps monticola]|nr:hypothetical protein E4U59_006960 [Claviceps monticola]
MHSQQLPATPSTPSAIKGKPHAGSIGGPHSTQRFLFQLQAFHRPHHLPSPFAIRRQPPAANPPFAVLSAARQLSIEQALSFLTNSFYSMGAPNEMPDRPGDGCPGIREARGRTSIIDSRSPSLGLATAYRTAPQDGSCHHHRIALCAIHVHPSPGRRTVASHTPPCPQPFPFPLQSTGQHVCASRVSGALDQSGRQQPQPPQQPTSSSAAYSLDAESVWYMPGARDSRLRDGNSLCWYRVPPNYLRPSPSLLPAYVPYLLYCHLVSPSRVTPMDAGPRRALPRHLLSSFLICLCSVAGHGLLLLHLEPLYPILIRLIVLQRLHGLILLLRSLRPLIHTITLVQAHINHSHTHLDTTTLEPALPQAIIRILLLRLFSFPRLSPLQLLLPNLFHSQNTVMHNIILS